MRSGLKVLLTGLLAGAMTCGAAQGAIKLSGPVRQKSEALLEHLHHRGESYTTEVYFSELNELGRQALKDGAVQKALKEGGAETAQEILVVLSAGAQSDQEQAKLAELKDWYGCYDYEVSASAIASYMKRYPEARIAISIREEAMKMHTGPKVCPLLAGHSVPEYLAAWEIWYLAPGSAETQLMGSRIVSALRKIADPSYILLMMDMYRFKVAGARSPEEKLSIGVSWRDRIEPMPGQAALDAFLELNRDAVAGGYAGESWDGFTRQIVRKISSRSLYADQMEIPELAEMMKDLPPKRVKEISRTDSCWKIYKPLIEARLKAGGEKIPAADLDVLKQAMEAMPKE